MMRFLTGITVALAIILLAVGASAANFQAGDRVELEATNPLGVPLHFEARSSMFDRGKDGDPGIVIEIARNGRWVHVSLDDGREAWIVEKYLIKSDVTEQPTEPTVDEAATAAVFASSERCEGVIDAGGRMAPNLPNRLRLATWNIRWFPVGDPKEFGNETDLAWLACAIAWMNLDVLAFQESLDTREADVAWAAVADGVGAVLGGDWRVDLQECGGEGSQHVGFLWNADAVELSDFSDRWQMNGAATGHGSDCAGNIRPGRTAYVKSRQGGADFHLTVVHLDSGTKQRDFDHRVAAIQRIDDLFQTLQAVEPDADLIVMGDFNTMGASGVSSPDAEIESFRQEVGGLTSPMTALIPSLACTEYFGGSCGVLDHVVVAKDMAEAASAQVIVSGYCAVAGGAEFQPGIMPLAYENLSDHCPVVIQIEDVDRD